MKQSNYKRIQQAHEVSRTGRRPAQLSIAEALWQIALTYASAVDIQTGMTIPSSVSSREMISQALQSKEEQ